MGIGMNTITMFIALMISFIRDGGAVADVIVVDLLGGALVGRPAAVPGAPLARYRHESPQRGPGKGQVRRSDMTPDLALSRRSG